MDLLDSLNHLNCNLQYCFQVKLPPALLEQIFQTLSQQVHHHYVVSFAILSLLVPHEVKVGYARLPPQFMDKLRLPEQHDVSLVFNGLLHLGSKEFSCLLLFYLVDLSKSSSSNLLNYLIPFF